jgi:CheY-like chemotaxis protein
MVQHQATDVVVADPAADGTVQVEALENLRRQFPSLPVVVYTSLAPAGIKAIVRLAKSGVEHVVLNRFDDEPGRFLELLEGIPAYALGEQMLQELAGSLSNLPVTVVRAIDQLFRSPGDFKNAQDLAAAAGMNLRTLYRNLEPAGLFSARLCILAGPGTVDQGCGSQSRLSLPLATLATNAGAHRTHDRTGTTGSHRPCARLPALRAGAAQETEVDDVEGCPRLSRVAACGFTGHQPTATGKRVDGARETGASARR